MDADADAAKEELRRRLAAARRGADAAALVVTRADGVGADSTRLGALAGVLGGGGGGGEGVDGPARAGLRCLLQAEKSRLEAAMAAGCLAGFPTESDRCAARTFLQEKVRVLDAALRRI